MTTVPGNETTVSYPQAGRMKRALSGAFFSVFGEAINSVQQIVLVPLFLWAWGKDTYGEWLTIFAMVGYLPLMDIGIQNCVVNRLTQEYSSGNLTEYKKVLHSALQLYTLIVFFGALVLGLFLFGTPFTAWLNITNTPPGEVKYAAMLLGMYLLASIPNGVIGGVYSSIGEYPRRAMLVNLQQIVLLVLLICVLLLKPSFTTVSLVYFLPVVGMMVFTIVDVTRRHREIQYGFSAASWKDAASFLHPGFLFLLIMLANMLKAQGSVLLVGAAVGAGAVAVFSVHRTLANLIVKIMGSINNAAWPEVTATEAIKDYDRLRAMHDVLMKGALFLSTAFAIFLWFAGQDILSLWTRDKISCDPLLWALLMAYLPINCLWECSATFQVATNKHGLYSICKGIAAPLGLLLAVWLTRAWGMAGAFAGFMIVEILICWLIPLRTLRLLDVQVPRFLASILGVGVLIAILEMAAGYLLYALIPGDGMIRIIAILAGVFVVGGVSCVFLWMNKSEKQMIERLFARLRR